MLSETSLLMYLIKIYFFSFRSAASCLHLSIHPVPCILSAQSFLLTEGNVEEPPRRHQHICHLRAKLRPVINVVPYWPSAFPQIIRFGMRTALISISIRIFEAENNSLWLAESATRIAKNDFKSTTGKGADRKKYFQILIVVRISLSVGKKTLISMSKPTIFSKKFGRGEIQSVHFLDKVIGSSWLWLNVAEPCGLRVRTALINLHRGAGRDTDRLKITHSLLRIECG